MLIMCRMISLCHTQLRGSVPLYWSQQSSALSPKPDIILQNFDPMFEVRGQSALSTPCGKKECSLVIQTVMPLPLEKCRASPLGDVH